MSYISIKNVDKIALEVFRSLADEKLLDNVQFELMTKIREHNSIYTVMDILSHYIAEGLINPVDLFYETDDRYEALMLWKASEGSNFYREDFLSCWDEENPLLGWKREILSVHQFDIEINKRQGLLKIIPESER